MEGIKIVKITDPEYPKSLKKIKDAPKTLYYRGILPKDSEQCFAVVGTRHPSAYGQQAALQISQDLINHNITIVSGLAPGIDTFSHRAAVEMKKRTIAVLGSGIDEKTIYPRTNLLLSRKIVEYGGCLISELPEGTNGTRYTFPNRNRIISGLSSGVLVVEAKEKSGSLITANYAIKQNKKLFAVPGPIYSLNSWGTNYLIKSGAKLTATVHDILEELKINQLQLPHKKIEASSEEERLILDILKNGAVDIDKIIEKTKLKASLVASTLALMEVSDKVRNLGSNTYSLN
ncbi:MAG TPA: DNA-processing protein DprA [Candidatus Staskawiczbacteria bacterium]|nr:DNA-processing protein DprA [Candidatus Staskawiczbacteria bacterium]